MMSSNNVPERRAAAIDADTSPAAGGEVPAGGVESVFTKSTRFGEGMLGHRLSILVVLIGVFIVASLVLVLLVVLQGARREALDAARASTANLTRVMADATARTTESVDIALSSIVALVGGDAVLKVPPEAARQIRDRLAYTPVLRQIVVTDAGGRVVFDTNSVGDGGEDGAKKLALDNYLMGEEATRRTLIIGHTETRRFLGGPTGPSQSLIPMARRIYSADGRLIGVVVAAVNPLHFLSVAGLLDLGDAKWVALYRFDGMPLAGGDGAPAAADVVSALRRREEAGTRQAEMADGVARIVSYRATPIWPLVVEIGVSKETALAGWRQGVVELAPPVGAVVLVVLVLTAALALAVQRHFRDEAVKRLSNEVLRSIKSGVAIIDLNLPGRPIVYVNAALEGMFGIGADRLISAPLAARTGPGTGAAMPGGAAADGLALLRQAVAGGTPGETARRPFRRGHETVWCDVALLMVADEREKSSHGVVVVHEVTEQVLAEQELLRSLDELAVLHDEQARFSEIFAHHLQEPVRRIVAHGQLLRRSVGGHMNADADAALKVLDQSGRRLKHLLRDVELYISAGVSLRTTGQTALDDALQEVLARERYRLDEIQAQVVLNPLPVVAVAKETLVEVLFAVVDNAITYRAPERRLILSADASRHGDEWVVCLEDNGIGIDRSFHERIFRAFERLHVDDAHPGTGIGLALARKLVERVGGRIWVDSEPGFGSRFFIALPAATVAATELTQPVPDYPVPDYNAEAT